MRKMGNRNLWASQTKPCKILRLKTKFGLVNAIFSHWAKKRERKREREREREGERERKR